MDRTRTTGEALGLLTAALDSIDHGERRTIGHGERLRLVEVARTAAGRVQALLGVLVAEADDAKSSLVARGTPTDSWLALEASTSPQDAASLVFTGRDLIARPGIQEAALDGTVAVRQARTIARVMGALPADLDGPQRVAVEERLLELAATTRADRLARLGPHVLAEVCPERCETLESELERLESQARRARAKRSLSFFDDGDGSTLIRGCLPTLDATPFMKVIGAYVESDRRAGRDRRDPLAESRTPDQRRADALVTLIADQGTGHPTPHAEQHGGELRPDAKHPAISNGRLAPDEERVGTSPTYGLRGRNDDPIVRSSPKHRAPSVCGDRPRIIVFMHEGALRARAEQAGVLPSGQKISAGDLRRLCCDADLTPVVLSAESEILDVGSTRRLVTPDIRRTLSYRDNGCLFPGCTKPDHECDAHHIRPWTEGGPTALHNLVSLCPHHHALVEPPRFWNGPPPDRWTIRLGAHGRPEVLPPKRVDPRQAPMACNRNSPLDALGDRVPGHRPSG